MIYYAIFFEKINKKNYIFFLIIKKLQRDSLFFVFLKMLNEMRRILSIIMLYICRLIT